jgi:glycosyltransferase involved in cell wall biosynthesis
LYRRKMKIAVLSKADACGGGASKVAVDLTSSLAQLGVDSTHYVGWAGRERLRDAYPSHVTPAFGGFPQRILVKTALLTQWTLGYPERLPVEWPSIVTSGILEADLIHIHDITELMSARTLAWLSQRKPVVWTLHDMSALTAGCIATFDHEPQGCERWTQDASGCDAHCPIRAIRGYPFGGTFNGVPSLWRAKQRLARTGQMTLVAPSTWLASEVHRSHLYAGRHIDVIHNGINVTDDFTPRPKIESRAALGLDPNRLTIALMAGHLSDHNKGFAASLDTLRKLPESLRANLQVICIGRHDGLNHEALNEFHPVWTGYVQDTQLLAIYLSAADVLLYPSMADNQPLAVIESLACGTPVFAFDTGGIAEIIQDGAGVVVARKDTHALALALASHYTAGELAPMSLHARQRALSGFTRHRMATDYLGLYQRLLAKAVDVSN